VNYSEKVLFFSQFLLYGRDDQIHVFKDPVPIRFHGEQIRIRSDSAFF